MTKVEKKLKKHVNLENHKCDSKMKGILYIQVFCTDVSKMPYFDYCSLLWVILAEIYRDKPQQLNGHNKAARITTFSNYKVRSSFFKITLAWKG